MRYRAGFTAGCRIVSADYSQIELRIMAHLSGDEGMLKAFEAMANCMYGEIDGDQHVQADSKKHM